MDTPSITVKNSEPFEDKTVPTLDVDDIPTDTTTQETEESETQGKWYREQIAEMDPAIEKLRAWFKTHHFPSGLYSTAIKQFDLHSADEAISFAAYDYADLQKGKNRWVLERLDTLGWAIWVVAEASHRYTGYRAIYFRQLATLGGTICRAVNFRRQLERFDDEKREVLERKERQIVPSPWGNALCDGCGGAKRVWADMTQNVCSRCGTPLGELPAS